MAPHRSCFARRPVRSHRAPGFTLTEALVAIACVVLLLGIVLPGVGRLGTAARSARCMNNLRQIGVAALAYAAVHDDRFPPAILYFKKSSGIQTAAWDWVQGPPSEGGSPVRPGPLWAFADAPTEVLQCPDFVGPSTFGDDPVTGYSYNTTFIGAEGFLPKPKPGGGWIDGWDNARLGIAGPQHRRSAQTALFADAGWKSGANKFMRAPMNSVEKNLSLIYAGGQAFRHGGCCNVVYLDGHCACVNTPREGALAAPALLKDIMGYPNNGFLSDDDSAYDPR